MTLMWVVGGLVIGVLVFLMIRHKINKAEARDKFKNLTVTCTKGHTFDAAAAWQRVGLRGNLFLCPQCGERIWI